MKTLVISDIHGSSSSLRTALDSFPDFDLLMICGDYLNHGPRNPLPDGWNPKEVASILNPLADKIICVRGNCDSEVDEMVLTFPCLNAYTNVFFGRSRIFVHHGHLYDREKLCAWLPSGTIVISGHTHVTLMEEDGGLFFFNPGSISLPKCVDGKTCGLIETDEGGIKSIGLCSIDGNVIRSIEF
ncbi:MAG: phosphodiesterase [Treponema sp.]|nr:phosphodiesterase [Treponema sp.]